MSHELRTPLNAIIGFSQVLREEMFGEVNEKQEEYLDDILSSGNHLLSLINDVLDLSKVEAGQVELEVAPFSLRDALERGVVMVRERASKDGVRLALAADPEVDVVEGDERRIKQVIFNLLSNAVKFTPDGRVGRRERGAGQRRGAGSRSPTPAPASRPRIRSGSSRSSSRARPASSSARGPASASRSRSGSSSCTAAGSGSRASSARAAPSPSRCPRGRRSHGGRADPRRRGQREEHEAVPRRPRRDRLSHARGDDRRRGVDAGDRAHAGPRAHGHPAPGHRRRRGAPPAAGGRAHGVDPGARPDRASDARRPRAVPGGGLRRLRLEAGERRRARRHRAGSTARERRDERRRQPRSSSSTTCRRTCGCSRPCSRRAATTSSPRPTAHARSSSSRRRSRTSCCSTS